MLQPNRRTFLRAAASSLVIGTGCSRERKSGEFADRTLRVFCYAGGHEETMRRVFVPTFEAQTGASVELYPGWWDGIAKLKAAPANDPPFDLIISDATQGYPAIKDGMFAQLNLENIPNVKNLVPAMLDNAVVKDRYGVTYPDSVMTLAFNKTLVPDTPTRWSDLLRPALAGKVGLYTAFYMSLYTFACIRADTEGKAGTARRLIETDLDGCLTFAREHRARIRPWWPNSTDMIIALANGEAAIGNMHSPEYLAALRERPNLGAAVPKTDRAFVQVFWSVPAGSRNQDLAERAINAIFSDELQLGFAQRGMATSIPSVAAKVAESDPLWAALNPHTAEQFAGLNYYPYEAYAEHWDHIADAWERTVLRAG